MEYIIGEEKLLEIFHKKEERINCKYIFHILYLQLSGMCNLALERVGI